MAAIDTHNAPTGEAGLGQAGRARGYAPDLPAFDASIMASGLADMTKVQYVSRLGKLVDATGHTVAWTLEHCTESWELLRKTYSADNHATLRTFVNLALSLLSRAAIGQGMAAATVLEAQARWKELYTSVTLLALEHYETSEPTEKMLAGHVPWAELEQMRDKMIAESPHSMETLMLAMYTYLPPSRLDFGRTRIYGQRGGSPPPPRPDTAEEKATPNFLAIARGPDGAVKMTLTVSEFKTRCAKFPRSVRELPAALAALVEASLAAKPREWLLVSPRTSQPWKDDQAFGLYMRNALQRIFGKPVTANSIRHAFATSLDMNSLTPRGKDELAAKMMTSGRQLERYRMRLP